MQPQAFLSARGMTLKIFEIHSRTFFFNDLNVDRRYFLKESVFEGAKKSPRLLPEYFFA